MRNNNMTIAIKAIAVRYFKEEVVWVTPEGKVERKKYEGIRPEFELVVNARIKASINEQGVANVSKE